MRTACGFGDLDSADHRSYCLTCNAAWKTDRRMSRPRWWQRLISWAKQRPPESP